MAIEVKQYRYLFAKSNHSFDDEFGSVEEGLLDHFHTGSDLQFTVPPSTIGKAKAKLAYNPLHDLESVWRMLVFFELKKDIELVLRPPSSTSTPKHQQYSRLASVQRTSSPSRHSGSATNAWSY